VRAAIYTRISSDREGQERGVARQEQDCRELADRLGWEVAGSYSDNDTSASSGKRRPGWEQLLSDLRAGRVEAVLAYSSSRLYRRVRDLEGLLDLNPKIRTVVSGSIDLNTADGRMHARLLATIDQAEAERVGERIRRQKAQNRAGAAPGPSATSGGAAGGWSGRTRRRSSASSWSAR
jgi:site-specific DNA recombinase